MYINDLNSAYIYEHERRTDEMKAARHSHLLPPEAHNKHKKYLTLIVLVLFIIIWVAL